MSLKRFEIVPNEVKWIVLSYIEYKHFFDFFLVDKSWFEIQKNDIFWREVSRRDIKSEFNLKPKNLTWKQFFKETISYLDAYEFHDTEKNDFFMKIGVSGGLSSGKTTYLIAFRERKFDDVHIPTIGIDFKILSMRHKATKETIKIQVWDSSGNPTFEYILKSYYKGIDGLILVYDLSKKNEDLELSEIRKKYEYVLESKKKGKLKSIIIGTHLDKLKEEPNHKKIKEYAKKIGAKYFMISSKQLETVNKPIFFLINEILKQKREEPKVVKDKEIIELKESGDSKLESENINCNIQ